MKYFLILIFVVLSTSIAKSQFKVGANIAAAGGDVVGAYNMSFGFDGYYMFRNPDAFFKYGFNASLLFYPGNEVEVSGVPTEFKNAAYLPVSFDLRFTIFRVLTFGPDLGYALSLNSDNSGGVYVKGIMGLDIANAVELNVFVSNINTGENSGFTSLGAGFLIHLY